MATNTTTARKTAAKKVNTEVAEPVKAPATVEPKKKEVRKYEATEGIHCISLITGTLHIVGGKSGTHYKFTYQGDDMYIEYQDLLQMKNTKSIFVYAPFIYIDDDELLAQWPEVTKAYEKTGDAFDFDNVLTSDLDDMKAIIAGMHPGVAAAFKSHISTKILSGEFDSANKIKAIDEVLGTSFAIDI